MSADEIEAHEYVIRGREGDQIVVRHQGTLTIMDIDPAIQRKIDQVCEEARAAKSARNICNRVARLFEI